MKEVHDVRVPLAALAGRLNCDPSPQWFRFLVERLKIRDLRVDGDALVYPSFIPVEQLLRESIDDLAARGVRPTTCRACGRMHDDDADEGIFEDPQALDGFICRTCAEGMTAWEYYNQRLRGSW